MDGVAVSAGTGGIPAPARQRLVLAEIAAEQFGGMTGRVLHLPVGSRAVVVYGDNETGKSSAVHLLSWLLYGPPGDAHSAQAVAPKRAELAGELRGTAGDEVLEIRGAFRIQGKGGVKVSSLTVTRGSRPVSAAAWRRWIGEPRLTASAHVLTGVALHDPALVERLVGDMAVGSFQGVDVSGVLEDLERRTRQLTESVAAGATSLRVLDEALAAADLELHEAARNAARHAEAVRRLDDLAGERAELERRVRALRGALRAVDAVTAVTPLDAELRAAELELAALAPVPAGWDVLLDRVDTAEALAERLDAARSGVDEAARRLAEAATAAGIPVPHAETLHLDPGIATRLLALSAEAERAAAESDAADAQVIPAAEQVGTAEGVFAAAASACPRASAGPWTVEDPALGRFDATAEAVARLAVERWERAHQEASDADAAARHAAGEARAALGRVAAAERAWAQVGGGDPVERPGRAVALRPLPLVVLALALVGLAVAAVVGAGWYGVAAAAVVLTVVVAGRLAGWWMPAGRATTVTAIASELVEARVVEARLTAGAEQAARVAAERIGAFRAVRGEAWAALERLGLPAAAAPAQATDALARLRELDVAARTLRVAVDALAARTRRARAARAEWEAATAALGGAAAEVGVAARSFDAAGVTAVLDVAERAGVWRGACDQLAGIEREWADLLAASGLDPARRPGDVVAEVRDLAGVRRRRDDLLRRVEALRRERAVHLAEPDAAELHAEGLDAAELERRAADTAAALATAEAGVAAADQETGRVRAEAEALAVEERVSEIRVRRGALAEQRDDVALELAAHHAAVVAVREAVASFEVKHQAGIIRRASELLSLVPGAAGDLLVRDHDGSRRVVLRRSRERAGELDARYLSTGARAAVYTALRVAVAEHLAATSGVVLPLVCDDPFVHVDEQRLAGVLAVLEAAAADRQVVLLTCRASLARHAVGRGWAFSEIAVA